MTTQTTYLDYLGQQTQAIAHDRPYPEPDLATIIQMRDEAFGKGFNAFHKACEKVEQYYRGTIKVPTAEGGQQIVVPTAHTLIETFADHIDTDNVQIDVRSGPRGEASAEIRAKFFTAVLAHSEQERMVLYTASKHLAMYGVAVIKRFHDADRWPKRPEAPDNTADEGAWNNFAEELAEFSRIRQITFPITDDVVNPKQVAWDLARGRKRWAMEKYKVTQEGLKKWFGSAYTIQGTSEVELTEYWDDQWMCILADNQWLVRPRWHGYHHLPYVIVEPSMGVDSADAPPEERYVGIITPNIQHLIDEESRLVSQYDTIVRATAWPSSWFQGPPELVALAKANWDKHPGALNVLPEGVTYNQEAPGAGVFAQILEVRRIIRDYIEDDTLPRVVRGAEPENRSSGFEVTARAGMARLKLKAAAKALASAIQELNVIAAKLLEHVIREPITVFAQTPQGLQEQRVRPRDVAGQYVSKVTLEASSPEDRINRGMYGMKLKEAGLASELMTRRDFLGQTNALEDMMRTKAEALWNSEPFMATMMQLAGDAFAVFLQQQKAIAQSTGGRNPGQFGPGAMAASATTQFPDQMGRVASRFRAIKPGSIQDINANLENLATPNAGTIPVTGGAQINPNGTPSYRR